ncbi:conserved hypothetical protein [Verticillium alfalfae VaMs.102]|uniref:Secreted protein n=1 Tax=Verticillium alfalfae (strain VaMs.102 / ATCC MYA-4576 / FGSC 10136) TaxID=526221 RepID=C9SFG6_VERA1|nr:conserved hypothetical protein [Verticillium alfalfae VaMs.102]EEY17952.1 conserved hypothetical protein [Verticillium alfalfae VaMs.102]
MLQLFFFLSAVLWALCISAQTQLTQFQAAQRFKAAGILSRSTGACTTKSNPRCTSFSGIRATTVAGAITLKKACKCSLIITSDTEVGHPTGKYSHSTGHKLDFAKNAALNRYVRGTFTRISNRSDGASRYKARSGNIYVDEGNHWDVTFFTDGS